MSIDVGKTERVSSGDKIELRLNVVDFGAVADDGVDDLYALQTAINSANREEVTSIYIPAGKYDINGHLFLEDNIAIEGDGQNTTILVDHLAGGNRHIIGADEKNNVKITNLTIMGAGIGKSGNCIHFKDVTNYIVSNTRLTNCGSGYDGAAIYARNTSKGEVTHNIILSARNGYLTPQGGGSKNVLIGYNSILNSRDDAIHPQTGSDNIIIGNMVKDSGDDNIDLWQENNALIENNTIVMHVKGDKIVDGIEIGDGSTNVVVKRNQITGTAGRGIMAKDSENIFLIDNNLRDLHYGCMRVQDARGMIIHHNRLSNC